MPISWDESEGIINNLKLLKVSLPDGEDRDLLDQAIRLIEEQRDQIKNFQAEFASQQEWAARIVQEGKEQENLVSQKIADMEQIGNIRLEGIEHFLRVHLGFGDPKAHEFCSFEDCREKTDTI